MGWFSKTLKAVFLFGPFTILAACSLTPPVCDGVDCGSGAVCIEQDYQATCVTTGGGGGGDTGGNTAGQSCDTTSDCQSGLSCLPDLNGNDVCTEQ